MAGLIMGAAGAALGGLFGDSKQEIKQAFNLSAVNKSIYEQITKNENESLASQAQIQQMRVVMRNVRGCSTILNQKIDAEASSSSELSNQQTAEIKNAITNEMQAAVQSQIEKVTEFGNMDFGSDQNVEQTLNLEVQNIVENTITTENINRAIAEQVSIQEGDLIIDGYDCREGGDIDFTQNITAKVAADVITNNLVDAIADSEMLSTFAADAASAQRAENKGLGDFFQKFFDGLLGPMKYAFIACIVCCIALVVLLVVMGLSPAGQSATKNLGSAGAARLGRAKKF